MTQHIFKYEINPYGFKGLFIYASVFMPAGSVIKKVAAQGEQMCAWAFVEMPGDSTVTYNFLISPTGGGVPDNADYIDTVFMNDGLVWHIFLERTES